jgi:hypothetical protein
MPKSDREYYLKQMMLELQWLNDGVSKIRLSLVRDGVGLDKIVRHLESQRQWDVKQHLDLPDLPLPPGNVQRKLSRPLPYQETSRGGTVQLSSASPDGTIVEKELKFLLSKGLAKIIALQLKNPPWDLSYSLAEELQALTQFASAAETSKDSS